MSTPSTPVANTLPLGLPAWAWSLFALLFGLSGSFAMADHEFRRLQRERSAELATISGVGESKLKRYGAEFLAVLKAAGPE